MKPLLHWIAVVLVGALSGIFFFVVAYALFHSAVFITEHFFRGVGSL